MLQMVHDVLEVTWAVQEPIKRQLGKCKIIWRGPVELKFYQRVFQFARQNPRFRLIFLVIQIQKKKRN